MKIFHVLILALFLFQLSKAEYVGVLNISTNSKHIVTGLYAQTVMETTTLITTTTIKPTTTTLITTTTLPEIHSKNITIKADEINKILENISTVLEKYIGKIDINRMKKTTFEILDDVIIKRELVIGNKSFLTTNIKYLGNKTLKNLIIYENLSKQFAINANDLKIFSDAKPIILEEDPILLFIYFNVSPNDTIFIRYSVDKEVNKNVLNESKIFVISEDFKKEKGTAIPLLLSIIFLIAFVILTYILISRKREYKYSFKRRRWQISFILKMKLKRFREKIKRIFKKEEEEKFIYQFKK